MGVNVGEITSRSTMTYLGRIKLPIEHQLLEIDTASMSNAHQKLSASLTTTMFVTFVSALLIRLSRSGLGVEKTLENATPPAVKRNKTV